MAFYQLQKATPRVSQRRAAFTLLEILVVLTIIGLLGALAFGVFTRVRAGTRLTTCATNLKQIGAAMRQYEQDHSPWTFYVSNNYLKMDTNCAWADRLLPYLRRPEFFVCPVREDLEYVPGCGPDPGVGVNANGGYNLNLPGHDDKVLHQSRLRQPATTISVIDGVGLPFQAFVQPPFTVEEQLVKQLGSPRHLQRINVLFADGHTKAHTYQELARREWWRAIN